MRRPPNFSVLFFVSLLTLHLIPTRAGPYTSCDSNCGTYSDCTGNSCCSTGCFPHTNYFDESYDMRECSLTERHKCTNIACDYMCLACPAGKTREESPGSGTDGGILHACLVDLPMCDAGTYGTHPSCTDCPVGYYSEDKGQAACTACNQDESTDKYSDEPRSTSCKTCVGGKHHRLEYPAIATSASQCEGCDAGKYSWGNYGACYQCQGGQYQPNNDNVGMCSSCPVGFHTRCEYSTANNDGCKGQDVCRECASGRYTEEIGATHYHCKACGQGKVTNGDKSGCEDCSGGKYAHSGECKTCEKGKSAPDSSGSTIWPNDGPCVTCPSGEYQDLAEATGYTCKTCGVGQFAGDAETSCVNCPAGYSQSKAVNDAWSCQECQAPEISSSDGESSCSSCSNGQYQNQNAQTSCKTCAGDSFAVSASSTECSQCPAGYYKDTSIVGYAGTIAAACPGCPVGFFQDEANKATCEICTNGLTAPTTSALTCQECGLGEAAASNTQQCTDCADGTYQDLTLNTQYSCKTCPNGWVSNGDTALTWQHRLQHYYCTSMQYPHQATNGYTEPADYTGYNPLPDTHPLYNGDDRILECAERCNAAFDGRSTAFTLWPCRCARADNTEWDDPGCVNTEYLWGKNLYDIVKKITACVQCQPGTKEVGLSTCETCADGKIQPSPGQTTCEQCDPGSIETNKLACVDCDPGTKEVGNTACVDCVAGKYQDLSKQTECELCVNGKYQDLLGSSECKTCGVGKYSTNNILPCSLCESGQYQNLSINNDYSCNVCPKNTSQPWQGSSNCEKCDDGEYTAGVGSTNCVCVSSGIPKKFGCSCDIEECAAGHVWDAQVCPQSDGDFGLLPSRNFSYECRSSIVGNIDEECAALSDKKACERMGPMTQRGKSMRCVWKPRALSKAESLTVCAQTDHCIGLVLRMQAATFDQTKTASRKCSYVSNTEFNYEPCICGDESCTYESGLRCDWPLLKDKQLGKISSVCSMQDCKIGHQNDEVCKCINTICPSGSHCTIEGTCINHFWDMVVHNNTIDAESRACGDSSLEAFILPPPNPDKCGVFGGKSTCYVCDIPFGESGKGKYNCPCTIKPKNTCPTNETVLNTSRYDKCGVCGGDCLEKCHVKTCDKKTEKSLDELFKKRDDRKKTDQTNETTGCSGRCGDRLVSLYEETEILFGTKVYIKTNGIPNHAYHQGVNKRNPHRVCEHNKSLLVDKNPVLGTIYKNTKMGVIGILKTGAFLFNHLTNEGTVAVVSEKETLDSCHGHASPHCEYHYHELSRAHACAYDLKWDECEHIGYMRDGFKIYSHCRKTKVSSFLKSCYTKTTGMDGTEDTHYVYEASDECDLDEANAYDFTGKGFVDSNDEPITGWAYIASESYPYVMPKYIGTAQPLLPYDGEISINSNTKCVPVSGALWLTHWTKHAICVDHPYAPGCDPHTCYRKDELTLDQLKGKCALQSPCGVKTWVYPPNLPATQVSFCTEEEATPSCSNGGMEPDCIDVCGIEHGDGSSCVIPITSPNRKKYFLSNIGCTVAYDTNSRSFGEYISTFEQCKEAIDELLVDGIDFTTDRLVDQIPGSSYSFSYTGSVEQHNQASVKDCWILYNRNIHAFSSSNKVVVSTTAVGKFNPIGYVHEFSGIQNSETSAATYVCKAPTTLCYGGLIPDACGVCGGPSISYCRVAMSLPEYIIGETDLAFKNVFNTVLRGTTTSDSVAFDFDTLKEIDIGKYTVHREDGTSYESQRYCNETDGFRCGECEGTCGDDAQCEGDLQCGATIHYLNGITTGDNYRKIPYGCMSSVEDAHSTTIWSVCFNSTKSSLKDIDRVLTPINNCGAESHLPTCKMCEGHCNTDADCEGTLSCFDRTSKQYIPGCAVGGAGDVSNMNYCYNNSGGTFTQSSLTDVTFEPGTILSGVSFREAGLRNVTFDGVILDSAIFIDAIFDAKDIFRAQSFINILGVEFATFDKDYAYDLSNKEVTGLDFSNALLQNANLLNVVGKLKNCPQQDHLPDAYFCVDGYISGFRTYHEHSRLWPVYKKISDVDIKNNKWLPTYEKNGVDTTKVVLVGQVPRSALFNPNIGNIDLDAGSMEHRGTPSEFKDCSNAALPHGYRCLRDKFVVGPGMDMTNVDISGMDLSDVDGTSTQWCMNTGKAASCPHNMFSMRDTQAIHGVYCIGGVMYGKGDIQGLPWAHSVFGEELVENMERVLLGNRLHWIFNRRLPEAQSLFVSVTVHQLNMLETLAVHDVVSPADCEIVLDIPYRVCVPNFMAHHLLYLDENNYDMTEAMKRLVNGFVDFQGDNVDAFSLMKLPSGYRFKYVQLKDYAEDKKPKYVRSPDACSHHEGYEDIPTASECSMLKDVSGESMTAGVPLATSRHIYHEYSARHDLGFVTEFAEIPTKSSVLSGCYSTCLSSSCSSTEFMTYEWSIPIHDSSFCSLTPYRCVCKKIDGWARSGVHILGPGVDLSALDSMNYIDFKDVSLENTNALGMPCMYSSFDGVLSVVNFHNFTYLKGSRFTHIIEGLDMSSLLTRDIGPLVEIRSPKVVCPRFGGSQSQCELQDSSTCVASESESPYINMLCGRLTPKECESDAQFVYDRKMLSQSGIQETIVPNWEGVEEDFRNVVLRGVYTSLLSGSYEAVTDSPGVFAYEKTPMSGRVTSKEECDMMGRSINAKIDATNAILRNIMRMTHIDFESVYEPCSNSTNWSPMCIRAFMVHDGTTFTREQLDSLTLYDLLTYAASLGGTTLEPALDWEVDVDDMCESFSWQGEKKWSECGWFKNLFPFGIHGHHDFLRWNVAWWEIDDELIAYNLDGVVWENNRCWGVSNIVGYYEPYIDTVWSKLYDPARCRADECQNVQPECEDGLHDFHCVCGSEESGKFCNIQNWKTKCWARIPLPGTEQRCNIHEYAFDCNKDTKCIWAGQSPLGIENTKLKNNDVFCDSEMLIGEDLYYNNQDLSRSDFSIVDSDTLDPTLDRGFDQIASCPLKLPDMWVCSPSQLKLHKDERLGSGSTLSMGEVSPLNIPYDIYETQCCRDFNFDNLDLGTVMVNQGERDFEGSSWKGAFGNAGNFLNVRFGANYKVHQSNDDKYFALVGPYVDLRNRDLFGANLHGANLTGADLRGITTGWNDKLVDTGCTSALPTNWSCVSRFYFDRMQFLIIGPEVDLSYSVLVNYDFSGVDLSSANLQGVSAALRGGGCPTALPLHWGCTGDSVLIGPSANLDNLKLTTLETTPPWSGRVSSCPISAPNPCLEGWFLGWSTDIDRLRGTDVTDVLWNGTDLTQTELRMIYGRAQDCPILNETLYKCIDNRIVGNFQNLTGVNMTGWDLSGIQMIGTDLMDSFGVLAECPEPGFGYNCIQNRLVGRGADISYMDFRGKNLTGVDMERYENLFSDTQYTYFRGSKGVLANCFEQKLNPGGSLCIENRIIGPEQDVSGIDFGEWNGMWLVDMTGIHGRAAACPTYDCVGRRAPGCPSTGVTCSQSKVFIGPHVDLQILFLNETAFQRDVWDMVDIVGVDFTGYDLSDTGFRRVFGRVKECPAVPPKGHVCRAKYILPKKEFLRGQEYPPSGAQYAQGWKLNTPPDGIDVSGLLLSNMVLPQVSLDNTVWHNVMVNHTITSMEHVYGTTNLNCNNTNLPDGIRCVESDDMKVIVRSYTNLMSRNLKNDFWSDREDFSNLQTNGGTWKDIRFSGVKLTGSDLSRVKFRNVWGYVHNENGHPTSYPRDCVTIGPWVFSTGSRVYIDIDFDNKPPEFKNATFPQMSFAKMVKNLNVADIDLSQVKFKGGLESIVGSPTKCPAELPDGWACAGTPLHIFGPYQVIGPVNITAEHSFEIIDMTGMDVTGWVFDESYDTRKYTDDLQWYGTNIIGQPENNPRYFKIISGQWVGPGTVHEGRLLVDNLTNVYLQDTDLSGANLEQNNDDVVRIEGQPKSLPDGVIMLDTEFGLFLTGKGLVFDDDIFKIQTNDTSTDPNEPLPDLSGLGGPLKRCVSNVDTHVCLDNWLLGPGVLWEGYNQPLANLSLVQLSTRFEINDIPYGLTICPAALPKDYDCIEMTDGTYSLIGPYMDVLGKRFHITENMKLNVRGSYLDGTYWTGENSSIYFDFDEDTSWTGVVFTPSVSVFKQNQTKCPFKFEPRICDIDSITCNVRHLDPNILVYDGYIWPGDQPFSDPNLCIRNMNLTQLVDPELAMLNNDIAGVSFPYNSSGLTFNAPPIGYVDSCPQIVQKGYSCVALIRGNVTKYTFVHPKTSLNNVDVTGLDLSGISFMPNVEWSNVYGELFSCPNKTPNGWECIDNILFGKNTDYSNITLPDFQDINLDGLDLSGSTFAIEQNLRNFRGNLDECPITLPAHYECYRKPAPCTDQCYFILGPYVSIQEVDMQKTEVGKGVQLELHGIHGEATSCPTFESKWIDAGYACSERTQYYIVGPGVDLKGINLAKLTEDLSVIAEGKVSLSFAIYNDYYIVDDVGTSKVCDTYEQHIISGICEECDKKII